MAQRDMYLAALTLVFYESRARLRPPISYIRPSAAAKMPSVTPGSTEIRLKLRIHHRYQTHFGPIPVPRKPNSWHDPRTNSGLPAARTKMPGQPVLTAPKNGPRMCLPSSRSNWCKQFLRDTAYGLIEAPPPTLFVRG